MGTATSPVRGTGLPHESNPRARRNRRGSRRWHDPGQNLLAPSPAVPRGYLSPLHRGSGGAGGSVCDSGDANRGPAKTKQTEKSSRHWCFSPFMAEFGHCLGCWSPLHQDGGGTAGWVTPALCWWPDESVWRQTQLYTTGMSRGCKGPWGLLGVPSQLRGPRSTGASPSALGLCCQGSRWQATPCCFGCSSASASALCGRSLQNKRCRGGLCVGQGPSFEPAAPVVCLLALCLARRWLYFPFVQQRGRVEG